MSDNGALAATLAALNKRIEALTAEIRAIRLALEGGQDDRGSTGEEPRR